MKGFACHMVVCTLICTAAHAQNPDINLLKRINSPNPSCQTYWMHTSHSAYWVAPTYTLGTLGYGLLYKDKPAVKKGLESAISIGMSIVAAGGLKTIVNRPRPTQSFPDEIKSYTYSEGKSFPSGHTAIAFATATTLSLQYKKWYITVPAYAWAASVGYSRMKLGRHYPTDVAAGAIIGIGSGYLSHWLTKKIFKD